jgi:acyl-CoA thioesterase II
VTPLEELIDILRLEQTGEDCFVGRGSSGDGADGTYGGHFLGQATAAALLTVAREQTAHSLHAYFLRRGEPGLAIAYTVERVRDGVSFSSRRVRAFQNDRLLFELHASFTRQSAGGLTQHASAPEDFASLPAPTSLPRYSELMASHDPVPLPEEWALREHGIDVRVVNAPWAPRGPSTAGGIRMWIRANGQLPDDPQLHNAALAYQSDESLADSLLVPFGVTWGDEGVFCVSLDHAMWFHDVVDLNAWHFVEQRAVTVTNERGVGTGSVWSADGRLVASFTQEVLLRIAGASR